MCSWEIGSVCTTVNVACTSMILGFRNAHFFALYLSIKHTKKTWKTVVNEGWIGVCSKLWSNVASVSS